MLVHRTSAEVGIDSKGIYIEAYCLGENKRFRVENEESLAVEVGQCFKILLSPDHSTVVSPEWAIKSILSFLWVDIEEFLDGC